MLAAEQAHGALGRGIKAELALVVVVQAAGHVVARAALVVQAARDQVGAVQRGLGLQGARVVVTDPEGIENARKAFPDLHYVESVEEAVRGADAGLLLTEWQEYKDLDPEALGKLIGRRNIVDGRNVLDPERWREAGA